MSEAQAIQHREHRVPPRVRRLAVKTGATQIVTDYESDPDRVSLRYDGDDPPDMIWPDILDGYELYMVDWLPNGAIYVSFSPVEAAR